MLYDHDTVLRIGGAGHIHRLAAEGLARGKREDVVHVALLPGAVRDLVEELAAFFPTRAGVALAEHPELVVGRAAKGRIDRREVRRAIVDHLDTLDHLARGHVDAI